MISTLNRLSPREAIKHAAGRLARATIPQCDFARTVFLFGHMRCGSTALSNVLCSRPEVSGYGEAHITWDNAHALGRLVINQRRRGAWKPGAHYLFDKVLHTRYDAAPAPGLARDGRAIFLVREPESAILSIRTLFARIGSQEYPTDGSAADYYERRLAHLASLWHRFPPEHRMGTTYAALTADPETALARASDLLSLDPPLANAYVPRAQTSRPGAGDPLSSHRFTSIVKPQSSTSLDKAPGRAGLTEDHLARLDRLYADVSALFAAG